jgi:hypothetical protein
MCNITTLRGSHSSITVDHNPLDEAVFLVQCHMVDVIPKVAVFTDVTGLATSVAGLHERFECPSMVDVHSDARR